MVQKHEESTKHFILDEAITAMLKVAWEKLCADQYADFTYRMRRSGKKQQCVSQEIWESWQKAWEDPAFKRKREIFAQNRRSKTGGDGAGPSRHTGGSISAIDEHRGADLPIHGRRYRRTPSQTRGGPFIPIPHKQSTINSQHKRRLCTPERQPEVAGALAATGKEPDRLSFNQSRRNKEKERGQSLSSTKTGVAARLSSCVHRSCEQEARLARTVVAAAMGKNGGANDRRRSEMQGER
ncbi:hypothetical protein JCGZ_25131 [Jatropha curcas]|uniref:Uncharacterized protein n=1 Tax=Jatropha curcas TaxID=180498 RepID=A0A067JPY7_JATCU|nr:hypothetical protein JCGZ_25131 [Jatropha curcas]